MIEPSFRAVLVLLVGLPVLLHLRFLSAAIPAVSLSPVAGAADGEHRPASRTPANQLVPSHLGHAPHDPTAV